MVDGTVFLQGRAILKLALAHESHNTTRKWNLARRTTCPSQARLLSGFSCQAVAALEGPAARTFAAVIGGLAADAAAVPSSGFAAPK